MTVRMFAGDLRGGLIRVRNIPVTGASASVKIGAAGSISADLKFPLVDPYTQVPIPFLDQIAPTKSFLGYEEFGKIVNAGPIWSDIADLDANTLSLTAAGLRSVWDYRMVLPALLDTNRDDLPIGKDTSYSNLSYGTIAKRLIQQAQSWSSGSFPIVFEDDVLGDYVRNYAGEDLKNLGEALDQLSGVINGPDIAFRPRFTTDGNHVEWVMMTGTPLAQPGSPHLFDMSVPNAAVRGAKRTRDGSAIVTDDYQTGSVPDDPPDAKALMAKSVDTLLTRPGEIVNLFTDPRATKAATYIAAVTGGTATPSGVAVTLPTGLSTTAARATATASGTTLGLSTPWGLIVRADALTGDGVGLWVRSSRAGTGSVTVTFANASNVQVGAQVVVPAGPLTAGGWTFLNITATPTAAGAVRASISVGVSASIAAGDTLDITRITYAQAAAVPTGGITGSDVTTDATESGWNGPVDASTSSQWRTGGYPRMEASTDRSSVTELQTLQDYADAAVKLGEKMTETWTFNARKTSAPTLNDYSEGDFCTLRTKSAILGAGDHQLRMIEISVKMGDQFAAISCAPVRS